MAKREHSASQTYGGYSGRDALWGAGSGGVKGAILGGLGGHGLGKVNKLRLQAIQQLDAVPNKRVLSELGMSKNDVIKGLRRIPKGGALKGALVVGGIGAGIGAARGAVSGLRRRYVHGGTTKHSSAYLTKESAVAIDFGAFSDELVKIADAAAPVKMGFQGAKAALKLKNPMGSWKGLSGTAKKVPDKVISDFHGRAASRIPFAQGSMP